MLQGHEELHLHKQAAIIQCLMELKDADFSKMLCLAALSFLCCCLFVCSAFAYLDFFSFAISPEAQSFSLRMCLLQDSVHALSGSGKHVMWLGFPAFVLRDESTHGVWYLTLEDSLFDGSI